MTYQDDEHILDAMLELAAGRLEGPEAEALRRRMQTDTALAEEFSGLEPLVRGLESYGDTLVFALPSIDIADSVMARVAALGPDDARIVPFETHARPRRRLAAWAVAAAVAAASIAALWLGLADTRPSPMKDVSQNIPAPTGDSFEGVAPLELGTDTTIAVATPPKPGTEEPASEPALPGTAEDHPTALAKQEISVDDVIKQRQSAARSDEAREVLARWAALSPDRARAVLTEPDASTDAIVGAALVLGGAESAPYLQRAAAEKPEDAYLNLELAKATGTAPKPELDDENALGWYVYARQLLSDDPPNLPEALKALEIAQGYTKAHAYTIEAAKYQEQALIASGMPADSAHLLTAFTAGSSEYDDMVALGNDLLSYAQYFQDLGDSGAAQSITESVQRFGEQLNAGALFSHERFAGLELQDAALHVLETMYSGAQMDSLAQGMESVAAGFNGLVAFMGNLNQLLGQVLPNDMWSIIADIILQQGDLQIFNNLPPIPQP